MIINKFGGASIRDANSIKRMAEICKFQVQSGILVVSAMGKITNLLEKVVLTYFNNEDFSVHFNEYLVFHMKIIDEIFAENTSVVKNFEMLAQNLKAKLEQAPSLNYDFEYDQIVPYGEIAATLIVSEFLNKSGINNTLVDIRKNLRTNETYRNAKVDWTLASEFIPKAFPEFQQKLYITQGFIGSDINNNMTTLGREGSDFTAAVIAFVLNAEKVVVWKDVPGILCADPEWIPNTQKIDQLSYYDAIELAFYGAKVIHPKTIKPLQNKKIPLQVRSFINQNNQGTLINSFENLDIPPVFIKKDNQVLISIKPTDYSFIMEENLSHIFSILAENQVKVNMMQNSAVSFSISVDNEMFRVAKAIKVLKEYYNVKYNDNLELITIRHNQPGVELEVLLGKIILVEQHTRSVARYLVRNS